MLLLKTCWLEQYEIATHLHCFTPSAVLSLLQMTLSKPHSLWFIGLKGGTMARWPSGLVEHYKNYITQVLSWLLPLLYYIFCIPSASYSGSASVCMFIMSAVRRGIATKRVSWRGCWAMTKDCLVPFSQVKEFCATFELPKMRWRWTKQ